MKVLLNLIDMLTVHIADLSKSVMPTVIFFHLFGTGTGTSGIGKNSSVFPEIDKNYKSQLLKRKMV